MWVNWNTHSNIIFEREDYVEFIYPAAENKEKQKSGFSMFCLLATLTHKHTRTGPGSTLGKAQLNKLCAWLARSRWHFPWAFVSISDPPGLDSQIKFTPNVAKCVSWTTSEPQIFLDRIPWCQTTYLSFKNLYFSRTEGKKRSDVDQSFTSTSHPPSL